MSVTSKKRLLEKLSKKAYRDAYAEESVKTTLPFQIKAIREMREWSQTLLGDKSEMKQNAISRLESSEYGNLNINTLLRLASAFDCALLVKFVSFSRLVGEFEDLSPDGLRVTSFENNVSALAYWATAETLEVTFSASGYEDAFSLSTSREAATPLGQITVATGLGGILEYEQIG